MGLSLTSLAQSDRDLLHLLYRGSRKKREHLGDAPPPRAMEELGQAHTEGGVAAVHVRDVTRVLEDTQQVVTLNNVACGQGHQAARPEDEGTFFSCFFSH